MPPLKYPVGITHILETPYQAESAEKILKKGMQIYIEGKLQTRQWIDKDNVKRNITEVVGESYKVLQKREGTGNSSFEEGMENNAI